MIPERAYLVGTVLAPERRYRVEGSIQELALMARTAGAEVVGHTIQDLDRPRSATLVGRGKLREIGETITELEVDLVIFDSELTPAQNRNLEDILKVKVLDRTGLILDIFAMRARSREGKLQVELAQLIYTLPRLSGKGIMLSRLGGGIGTRGPGETKLEVDRRRVKDRMGTIRRRLIDVRRTRTLHRKMRKMSSTPTVALVGYTNAGKSTLFNALTGSGVFVEDRLFATLDPTLRKIVLPDGRKAILADTVGFIKKLPHQLVESFKSTLEEVVEADLLVLVVDSTLESIEEHVAAVDEVLEEIGAADTPKITALNKADVNGGHARAMGLMGKLLEPVVISALTGLGLELLAKKIARILSSGSGLYRLEIPTTQGELISDVYDRGQVIRREDREDKVVLWARLDPELAASLELYRQDETP